MQAGFEVSPAYDGVLGAVVVDTQGDHTPQLVAEAAAPAAAPWPPPQRAAAAAAPRLPSPCNRCGGGACAGPAAGMLGGSVGWHCCNAPFSVFLSLSCSPWPTRLCDGWVLCGPGCAVPFLLLSLRLLGS